MLLIILGHVLLDLLADLVHATEVVDLLGAPHSVLHDDLTQAMLDKVQHEVLHIDLFLCKKHALALEKILGAHVGVRVRRSRKGIALGRRAIIR